MTDPDDDLGELLAPRPGPPSAAFRDQLLRRTASRLARRRWVRRGVRAGAIAGVFALGGLTGWLARPPAAPQHLPAPPPEIVAVPVPMVVPVTIPPKSPSVASQVANQVLSGSQLELQAEQADGPPAAALYKSAGDAFLREEDYANATRCYRLYLVRGGDAALSLGPDDSWLLTSLKNAAFQEKSRVQKTD